MLPAEPAVDDDVGGRAGDCYEDRVAGAVQEQGGPAPGGLENGIGFGIADEPVCEPCRRSVQITGG